MSVTLVARAPERHALRFCVGARRLGSIAAAWRPSGKDSERYLRVLDE
jgi:hypothetical protein